MRSKEIHQLVLFSIFVLMSAGDPQKNVYVSETQKKCISSSDCQEDHYCHFNGAHIANGNCMPLLPLNESCVTNRQCESGVCHFYVCVERLPLPGAQCIKDMHFYCNEDQYCARRNKAYKCVDRMCKGWCRNDAQCLSNKCPLFWCIVPEYGCPA
jgi:hypothetical protein